MFYDSESPLLGCSDLSHAVSVESVSEFVRVFIRNGDAVTFSDHRFSPFILIDSPKTLAGLAVPYSLKPLSGGLFYSHIVQFTTWHDASAAADYLKRTRATAEKPRFVWFADPAHQFMLSSGVTLFKGMELAELKVLSIDIETASSIKGHFSNAELPDDRILSIACVDSCGNEHIFADAAGGESRLINSLTELIRSSDPDVITGHNIFRFDLDYIWKRARLLGLKLQWGRNGKEPYIAEHARFQLPERWIDYPKWQIFGRHVIDTYFLTELYDLGPRALKSHGLKEVAKHFGLAAAERIYLDAADIASLMLTAPEKVAAYNLDDAREALALFRLFTPPWFVQSQMLPYQFQSVPLTGNATRINSIMVREYLRQGHSIPAPPQQFDNFEGGYTELQNQGVFAPVVHCDVASLYPSIMLCYRITSRQDQLGIFLQMLASLRKYRLQAKEGAKNAESPADKNRFETLQQVFKVLINSFFGYLGSRIHNFADPEQAAEITRLGRVTICQIIDEIKKLGGIPREVDTDGIYFTPPDCCDTEKDERQLVAEVSAKLPQGIDLEFDGRYRSIFAYKPKNYALLGYDGTITIKGSGLKSRSLEPYLKKFMQQMIELILNGKNGAVEKLYAENIRELSRENIRLEAVLKKETLNESPESYERKVKSGERNRSAAFEIAIKSKQKYTAGDQLQYYVSGMAKDVRIFEAAKPAESYHPSHHDINSAYYIEKLRQLKERFAAFLPQEPTLFDL